ncbi:lytic transglycosylase domain-containing protein [Paracoccus benzoatiresistens]|uniref:Lytic transglycosylase domain-containing protein n=1 Tax=Paracoccus benzoatiresistens TaxID=2997341 RepID=A0ABT4J0C4_9RHOB|nr:lytic transglycosylase domain-containing protein [Paracoccus sp. EF6]MCZ0960565.1 lytic transglycosylase domain-containing protein [Paracoccus sp. EF6]
MPFPRLSGLCKAAVAALAVLAAPAVQAFPAVDAVEGRPPAAQSDKVRCTDDGRDCIRLDHYAADVCMLIERNALERGLDPNFLARLLWKESRFEPGAISPVGALGIAQFMPGTAELYDLKDPFNPAQAIHKSAWYLRHLTDTFGNIGLAAVAYNGGENRAARFIGQNGGLPYETQDYVAAITGFEALRWRDNPPPPGELKLALDPDLDFRPACEKLAGERKLREFMVQPKVSPWGVIVASHPSQSGVSRQVSRLNRSLRPILGDKQVGYVRKRLSGMSRAVYTAQVGWDSKAEANRFCARFRQLGGRCIVLKN